MTPGTQMNPLLQVDQLRTYFHTREGVVRAVNDVSFTLNSGERMAVVGESGSGKSAMAMSLLQLLSYPGSVESGRVLLEGRDLLGMKEEELNHVRGGEIGTVFQDPMTSLDPIMSIGDQLVSHMIRHLRLNPRQARERAAQLLTQVGIPDSEARLRSYPYELSGGMRQRVLIAMALSCKPKLILADEPTTALDVTIQAQIVELLKDISTETGMALLFITHDLGLVARFAQKVAVMYAGRIVEYGSVYDLFERPQHPYTQSLLRTIPSIKGPRPKRLMQIGGFPPDMRQPIEGCAFADRCLAAVPQCRLEAPELEVKHGRQQAACLVDGGIEAVIGQTMPLHREGAEPLPQDELRVETRPVLELQQLTRHFKTDASLFKREGRTVRAVDEIELSLDPGQTLGLVGESGCGKSTTARMLLRLDTPTAGEIVVEGVDIAKLKGEALKSFRRKVQMVFQDPYSSFNPKMKIRDIIMEPLQVMDIGTREDRELKVQDLIRTVGLDTVYLDRYPSQLSGGQRQRIGIARALALDPSIIIADEPTSALDVSVRAQVINLLADLRERLGISILFISHDLSIVRHISDKIAVMYLGKIVEYGSADAIFEDPKHPYTQALLYAAPVPDPVAEEKRTIRLIGGDLPSPSNPPPGCHFSTRCPMVTDRCKQDQPVLEQMADTRKVACFHAS
ncbi:ABC transporter ATP-binding protein [Paenibacillus daejeonensis]|uniref:dipeptide ABC transporter ATP-binding protein n=1 Tax=Paenibacillus daejeonensis TaxID=135193 RepID=UPI00036BA5B6|nr:ABC transporter ATP-binding protein [Paenibacillus daejeonensis]